MELLSCSSSVGRLPAEKLLAWEAHNTASLATEMFRLSLVQLLQLLQAPMEPTEFKAQFLWLSSAIPIA